jgi:ribosome-associated protein
MNSPNDDNSDNAESIEKSKSQRKREATALQTLGKELVNLNQEQLNQIELPESLRRAINEAKKINKRGGLKRQLQYIGKIMRSIDAKPIIHAIDAMNQKDHHSNALFHQLEQWRDRLISDDKQALTEAFEAFPDADRQHLRHLIRKAVRERDENKPPESSRTLFRYLRELQEKQ